MRLNALSLSLCLAGPLAAPTLAHAGTSTADAAAAGAAAAGAATHKVELQQIRNATVKITYADTTFLIDPMLARKAAYPGFENTYHSELRNPLVELPEPVADVLAGVDAVIVTHTHLDHWDEAAQKALPKDIPLFAQHQADAQLIRSQGFTNVQVLSDKAEFGGVTLSKTGGQHGTDSMYANSKLATLLGEAMGVVFQAPGYKTLYLAGDTIWRKEVDQAIDTYRPEIIVLNAGQARVEGFDGAIIMGEQDVLKASRVAEKARIVAVHMDAVNHMTLSREQLQGFVKQQGIDNRVDIPQDGASLQF